MSFIEYWNTEWLCGYRIITSIWVIYPQDVVDCELQLTAAAQHYQKVLYCISLAQKKIKIQNLKYWISITLYYLKVKKLFKSNHHKLDTVCSNISHTCLSYIYHICSIFANFPFYYKPVLILSNHTEIIFLSVSFVF